MQNQLGEMEVDEEREMKRREKRCGFNGGEGRGEMQRWREEGQCWEEVQCTRWNDEQNSIQYSTIQPL